MSKRVIRLTETDLQSIVNRILKEQLQTGTEVTPTGTETQSIDLSVELPKTSYEAGKYKINSLNAEAKKIINSKITEVGNFMKNNANSNFTIQLEVGESAVTNYDREVCTQAGDTSERCKLAIGDLAKKRAETLVKYLTDSFNNLVTKGFIKEIPNIPAPKTNIELGTQKHKYTRGTDNPKDPKYLEDQYIKFDIKLNATKDVPTYDEKCLVGFVVDVSYKKDRNSEFPCRGGHRCDYAKFGVYLNDTELGVADLNNKSDGGDRDARFVVDEEKWKSITEKMAQEGKDTITLWTKCLSENCHTSVQEVKLSNEGATFEWNKCVNPQATRGDKSRSVLAVLDRCGKVLTADVANLSDVEEKSDSQDVIMQKAYVDIINQTGVNFKTGRDLLYLFSGLEVGGSTLSIEPNSSTIQGENLDLMVNNTGQQNAVLNTQVVGDVKKTKLVLPPNTQLKVVVPITPMSIPKRQVSAVETQIDNIVEKGKSRRTPPMIKINIGGSSLYFNTTRESTLKLKGLRRDVKIPQYTLFKVIPR